MDARSTDPGSSGDQSGTKAGPSGGRPTGRRLFLGMVGLGAVGIVAGSRLENFVGEMLAPIQRDVPNALGNLIPGGGQWQIYNASDGAFPDVSDAQFQLSVDGMVDTPLTLSYSDLVAMPPTTLVRTFQCVTGWRVPNVHWQGVALSEILDRAGVQVGGQRAAFLQL